jgi:exonuclease SbcD
MTDNFIYFTDPHIMGTTPVSRNDVYPEAIYKKFEYMIKYSIKKGCNRWLCGGDFFNSPLVDDETFNPFLDLFDKAYKDFKLTITSLLGNHDIRCKNLDTYLKGKHYAMNKHKWYKLFINHNGMYEFKNTVIIGLDYKKELEVCRTINLTQEIPENKALIVLVHNMLTGAEESKIINGRITELSYRDLYINPVPKLVLAGHYHPGFSIKTKREIVDEVKYANPGSLGRTKSDLSAKQVKVAFVEVNDKKEVSVKYIKIPTDFNAFKNDYVVKYNNVFSADRFLKAVSEFKSVKGRADEEITLLLRSIPEHEKDFGLEFKVTPDIIDMIVNKVEEIKVSRK